MSKNANDEKAAARLCLLFGFFKAEEEPWLCGQDTRRAELWANLHT